MVGIEIEVVRAVKASETFRLVLYGVRVHDVHDDGDAETVGFVDEVFQLLGCAEAA